MRRAEAVALGLLQGPAELLPISSSAHVGLALDRLGVAGAERKELEVALHAGSALALLERRSPRWGFLIAATAPPALAGLAFERVIEERLGTPRSIAAGLVLGSIAMVLADRMSRSGATLTAARARGFARADAFALSREVAVPVLAGATALKGLRLAQRRPPRQTLVALALGAAAAAISTAAAKRLGETPLSVWAAYRVALAVVIVCQDRGR
jgi:undecaprenyl-diphosphatase